MTLNDYLIWIDLEMTGVEPEHHVILEIATLVTDDELELVAEGPCLAINYPETVLSEMDEWSRTHHHASGLMDRVRTSPFDCGQAEQKTLDFLRVHCRERQSPLCGNSIWQDRRFLARYMPTLHEFFHYRTVDVSSIKELVRRWYPSLPPFRKEKAHLARTDIHESIAELRYYREKIFQP